MIHDYKERQEQMLSFKISFTYAVFLNIITQNNLVFWSTNLPLNSFHMAFNLFFLEHPQQFSYKFVYLVQRNMSIFF